MQYKREQVFKMGQTISSGTVTANISGNVSTSMVPAYSLKQAVKTGTGTIFTATTGKTAHVTMMVSSGATANSLGTVSNDGTAVAMLGVDAVGSGQTIGSGSAAIISVAATKNLTVAQGASNNITVFYFEV